MRTRKEIESDGTRKDILTLEVLLDIRELLRTQTVKQHRTLTRNKSKEAK